MIPEIPAIDLSAVEAARARIGILAKPPGSLGRLETLAIQLAGMRAEPFPKVERKAVFLAAGDHAIATNHGLSIAPAAVTALMVRNFCNRQGAAINVLARQMGARLVVVDAGVDADLADVQGLIQRKIRRGAADFSVGPAMTRDEAKRCVQTGIDLVREEAANGLDLLAPGDMGIGNTTPSAAITAVMTGLPVAQVTGAGTGVSDAVKAKKASLIEMGIARNRPDPSDALDVLAKVGGCEIGVMAGLFIGAASLRIPVVVDGFIASAAALIAQGLAPQCVNYMIPSHLSQEPGHIAAMAKLGLKPLFDFDMRLGEGTGAVLAFPLIEASTRLLAEMATLPELGVHL